MAKASRNKRYDVSADDMWKRIGGWGTMHEWHPAVTATEVSDDGSRRTLTLGDGATILEGLVEEGEHSYTYRFEETPLPVKDYTATISVREDGDGCVVDWEGSFEPDGADEAAAVEIIAGIYQAGLDAL